MAESTDSPSLSQEIDLNAEGFSHGAEKLRKQYLYDITADS